MGDREVAVVSIFEHRGFVGPVEHDDRFFQRQARDLVSYFVGQGVGLIDSVKSAGAVVQEFKEEFVEAVEHMNTLVAE